MSTPTEAPHEPRAPIALGASWRSHAAAAQEAVLPAGRVVVSCPAPFGVGGLGRHMREIVDALDRREQRCFYIHESAARTVLVSAPGDLRGAASPAPASGRGFARLAPDPWNVLAAAHRSPAVRLWAHSVGFDRRAARLKAQADHLIAFNGAASAQFRAARTCGYGSVAVVSATAHLDHVLRQQEQACRRHPLERPWARWLVARNRREYAHADRIYVASGYIRDSFIRRGVPAEKLSPFPLTPDPRFAAEGKPREREVFEIVYVGGLTVDKGVPILLEAVRLLSHKDLRLVLVGGWKSRGMRRFIQRACSEDGRVEVSSDDPLGHLRRASLYVHPAYSDGFGYAPAEALASGVPVIVSEHTGMKELISPGRDGLVVPTGDVHALAQAIASAYAGDLFRG